MYILVVYSVVYLHQILSASPFPNFRTFSRPPKKACLVWQLLLVHLPHLAVSDLLSLNGELSVLHVLCEQSHVLYVAPYVCLEGSSLLKF